MWLRTTVGNCGRDKLAKLRTSQLLQSLPPTSTTATVKESLGAAYATNPPRTIPTPQPEDVCGPNPSSFTHAVGSASIGVLHTWTAPSPSSPYSRATSMVSSQASEFDRKSPLKPSHTCRHTPAVQDQTQTVRSPDPDAKYLDEAAKEKTEPTWPPSTWTHSPDDQRHTRTLWSSEPEAKRSSDWCDASAWTEPR